MELKSLTTFLESDAWRNLLPLLTFLLGWVLSLITENARDRRTSTREKRNRDAAFLRESLLHIQEEVTSLLDHTFETSLEHDELSKLAAGMASYRIAILRIRLDVYSVRVTDELFRRLMNEVSESLYKLGVALGKQQDFTAELGQFFTNWLKANNRIGSLLGSI